MTEPLIVGESPRQELEQKTIVQADDAYVWPRVDAMGSLLAC